MKGEILKLSELQVGESGTVRRIDTKGMMRRRFLDIGLIESTYVECVGESPSGNPKAYLVRGAVIAIRKEDAQSIIVGRS